MKMTTDHFTVHSQCGMVTITFDGKPSEAVRRALKGNRFRWCPSSQYWWKQGGEWADFVHSLDKMMDRETGFAPKPDGECWECGAPGRFRNHGAATPVHCDSCHATHVAEREMNDRYGTDVDTLYEDQCRDACGL